MRHGLPNGFPIGDGEKGFFKRIMNEKAKAQKTEAIFPESEESEEPEVIIAESEELIEEEDIVDPTHTISKPSTGFVIEEDSIISFVENEIEPIIEENTKSNKKRKYKKKKKKTTEVS